VIGAVLMVIAQYYLRDLMGVAAEATAQIPVLPHLLDPDRWLFWLGIIFILLVYFFPKGIAGTIMARGERT
jgi:branched-chain amino acid transport system permease protein